MAEITLHGFPQSSFTWTARLACAEKGVDHDVAPIEFGAESHRALHPFAHIPAMTHGDFQLYETNAIVAYIDETFDGPALAPERPPATFRG